jgi:hypothetical protein
MCCGMEMNVEKTKLMRILMEPFPLQITDYETTGECEIFQVFTCLTTNDARCTSDTKFGITMAKAAFNRKKTLFTSKLDLNLRKKLIKHYIWSMALYGAETWTVRIVDKKYLESV